MYVVVITDKSSSYSIKYKDVLFSVSNMKDCEVRHLVCLASFQVDHIIVRILVSYMEQKQ